MEGYTSNAVNMAGAQRGLPPAVPTQSAIASHTLTMANACEMAASNLDRLKRFKTRLCGVTEIGVGAGSMNEKAAQPDGLLPRLNGLDEDMSRSLNQMAKLLDELDVIA